MVLCNSAHPLVIYFLAFWSRVFITECRFEVCKWDFTLVTWYPITQIFIAKTCGVLTCTRQRDNSGRYNSILVSVDTLITGSYNAVMSWEHLGVSTVYRTQLQLYSQIISCIMTGLIYRIQLLSTANIFCELFHIIKCNDLSHLKCLSFQKRAIILYKDHNTISSS